MSDSKKKMFCRHCTENEFKCGKNPIDCMNDPDAKIYFEHYDYRGTFLKHDGLEGKYDVKTHRLSL